MDRRITDSTGILFARRGGSRTVLLSCVSFIALLGFSAVASATPTYEQGNWETDYSPQSSIATTLGPQQAGNLNVVIVGWNSSEIPISSVTDTSGNTYEVAVGPTVIDRFAQSIYYAKNIVGSSGTNTVTVAFGGMVEYPDVRVAEYSGMDSVNPLDNAVGASGSGTSMSSGTLTTTTANALLVAGNTVEHSTIESDPNYTWRMQTNTQGLLQDLVVSSVGSYSSGAVQNECCFWVVQLAAFKAASTGGDTQAPTAPPNLIATAVSGTTQINLSWTASTDNVAVTGYRVERCQGAGCSSFTQIATLIGTTYSSTGLSASTSYSYRVRATDAANNLSGYSNTASAATQSGGPVTFTYTYDARGRIVQATGSDGSSIQYQYDANGNVTTINRQ